MTLMKEPKAMTEEIRKEALIREALKAAYAERADLNRRIDKLVTRLKLISPEYRKIIEKIEG